ncbi:MAG TPA: hypothetical protein VGR66_01395 [Candidatus Eisenbacteria bacterium]|nr:hypothetical protein [Candidatus Eisenbacteria bacterium]
MARRSAAAAVIGPGDGPILALDLVVPRNGYSPDILRGIRLANLGSAGAGDLASVQLWQDGGNGIFDAGGDDVLLGPLTTSGGEWTSPLLSQSVDGSGLRLFVAVTVASTPAESSTVRFQVPVGGIEMASDDDGPLDIPIENPDVILISSAPLLATLGTVRASTVGQTVTVSMAVRNTSGETIRGITPAPLTWSGSAFFQPVSGPIPPTFDLAPAQIDTFEWRLLADQPGDARFLGAAAGTGDPSGLARRAPPASSSLHQVYLAAQTLELTPIQTMPVRVNRGQADIVPFSLTLANPGGPSASDVSIERLRIRIENDAGAPVVPASLLDRVTVNEGTNVYAVKTALESSGANVDIAFSTPATVTGTQPATLSLRLDIAATTLVSAFRVVIEDSSALGAQDVTSGAPVTAIVSGGAFPVRSDLTSVVSEATGLEIAAAATQDTTRVGRGAQGVTLMRFRLTNQGVSGISSSVRLTSMGLALVDSAGAPLITPGARVTSLRLMDGGQTLATRPVAPADPESLSLLLEPRLDLPANSPLDVALVADVALAAPYGRFGARLLDSTLVDASDVNTREAVPVFFEPDTIRGGLIKVEAPAETLMLASTPSMPASVMIGQTDVMVMSARLRHPGGAEKARLRLDTWSFDCLDHLGRPLVPAAFLSRLRVRWNGSIAADLTDFPSTGNRVSVPLGGRMLEPGDTVRVDVSIDVDATAPAGFLQLVAPSLEARDANSSVLASVLGEPGTVLPPVSGLAHLVAPARELAVGLVSAMPAALAPDGRAVKVATLTLRSADSESSGPIQLDHLLWRGRDRAMVATAVGTVASRIEAWHQGVLWAQSGVLTPDSVSAWLAAPASLSIDPGDTVALEIRLITRLGAAAASLALGVDGSGIGVIQPGSALLAINVRPEQGSAFPLWTEAGSISGASLTDSYSNFPNPFAAGRQSTSFVYYLPGPGRVSLRILTLRGEPVATLLDRVPRTVGLQQADSWSGRNERGLVVYNGVYVAELDVQFDDGQVAHVLRKVAVVR